MGVDSTGPGVVSEMCTADLAGRRVGPPCLPT
jgi:hypothetical protein